MFAELQGRVAFQLLLGTGSIFKNKLFIGLFGTVSFYTLRSPYPQIRPPVGGMGYSEEKTLGTTTLLPLGNDRQVSESGERVPPCQRTPRGDISCGRRVQAASAECPARAPWGDGHPPADRAQGAAGQGQPPGDLPGCSAGGGAAAARLSPASNRTPDPGPLGCSPSQHQGSAECAGHMCPCVTHAGAQHLHTCAHGRAHKHVCSCVYMQASTLVRTHCFSGCVAACVRGCSGKAGGRRRATPVFSRQGLEEAARLLGGFDFPQWPEVFKSVRLFSSSPTDECASPRLSAAAGGEEPGWAGGVSNAPSIARPWILPQKALFPSSLGASCWADRLRGRWVRRREPSPGFQRPGSALPGGRLSRLRAPLPRSGLRGRQQPASERRPGRPCLAGRGSVCPPPRGAVL